MTAPTDLTTTTVPIFFQETPGTGQGETTGLTPGELKTPSEDGEGGGPARAPSLFDGMMPFLLIGLVLWFLIFAPEKKARKRRQVMLESLKKGDKVVTTGGLHAEVAEVREGEVVLKAGDSRFVYSRSAVQEIGTREDK